MLLFLGTLWMELLRLIGVVSPAPVQRKLKPRGGRPHRDRSAGPPESRRQRVRLSRINSPTVALRLIADMRGELSGVRRKPDARDLTTAWAQLGDPIQGFVQALIAIGESVPRFLASIDERAQFDALETRARRSVKVFLKAIGCGTPVRFSREAENTLARNVERHFRGKIPAATRTTGGAGDMEWHVRDSMGRPLLCRLLRHDDGRLEILDAHAGFLHRDTLRLSCWKLAPGWLLPSPPRIIGTRDGGLPTPGPRPGPTGPKA